MKIAIAVPGRFHAFDLAVALERLGHEVTLLTNYPSWSAPRFGLRPHQFRSFLLHGATSRIAGRLRNWLPEKKLEAGFAKAFGAWVARQWVSGRYDFIHVFSGVAEELLECAARRGELDRVLLMRGSSHIRTQWEILNQEVLRVQQDLDKPGDWMVAREEREYALARHIAVLSSFAARSFVEQGVPREKIHVLPLGAQTSLFRPVPEVVEARCRRVATAGARLRVIFVGTLSYRKGAFDLLNVCRALAGEAFEFTVIADVPPECTQLAGELRRYAKLLPRQPQDKLPLWYAEHDIFLFPTLEDGYAMVLAQAFTGAMCVVASENCSGPDLIRPGETGFLVPIRQPDLIVKRLTYLHENREELAALVARCYAQSAPKDWNQVAEEFQDTARGLIQAAPEGKR